MPDVPIRILKGQDGPLSWTGGLSLVFVSGRGPVIACGGKRFASVTGSGIFCFGDTDRPELIDRPESGEPDGSPGDFSVTRIFFTPSAINSQLDLSNIRGRPESMSGTVSLDRDFLKPFVMREGRFRGFIPAGINLGRKAGELIASLENELSEKRDQFWPCRSRSFFLELLFLVYKEFLAQGKDESILPGCDTECREESPLAEKVLDYIHCNYGGELSVPDLCVRFSTNRTTLAEKFREATGTTLTGYISRIRLGAACVFLRDTSLPVSEIVERTGFNDQTHFSRAFKKATGLSPRAYREESRASYGRKPYNPTGTRPGTR